MHLSQILPRLFVGSCPAKADDINHLKTDYGITAILNLQTDHDFDYWDLDWGRIEARCRDLQIEVRRIPVRDFDGLDLQEEALFLRDGIGRAAARRPHRLRPLQHRFGAFAQRGHRLPGLEARLESGRRRRAGHQSTALALPTSMPSCRPAAIGRRPRLRPAWSVT